MAWGKKPNKPKHPQIQTKRAIKQKLEHFVDILQYSVLVFWKNLIPFSSTVSKKNCFDKLIIKGICH